MDTFRGIFLDGLMFFVSLFTWIGEAAVWLVGFVAIPLGVIVVICLTVYAKYLLSDAIAQRSWEKAKEKKMQEVPK